MSEKQTLLQQGREKLNNSVLKFLQTEVSMKGMRNLAIAGLVSSAAIFGGEKLNKAIPLSPDQIRIASTSIKKAGLGDPSQLSKVLEANQKGVTVQQISEARSKLISPNLEISKSISDDLMERFNSNPNTDNLVALYQGLGEQNPQLKSKFDQAIKELGQDPESKPIDLKYISALIASISGGLLVLKTRKKVKDKIQDSQQDVTKIDEIIPSTQQKSETINNGEETLPTNFNAKLIQLSTGETLEQNVLKVKEVEGIKNDLDRYLNKLEAISNSEDNKLDKSKINYIYKFIKTLRKKIKSTPDIETVKNFKTVSNALIKSLLKSETQTLDAEGMYNYISSNRSRFVGKIPEDIFDEAQRQGLSAIYNLKI
jgi:hypothetical protein